MQDEEDQEREDQETLEEAALSVTQRLQDRGKELMEDVSREEDQANATPDIIAAIRCLSNREMCLAPFLQSRLLRAAACKTFEAVEHDDISNLRMHIGNLEGLLWCLLSSAPSLDRLNFLWEGSPDVPEVGDMAARLGLSIGDPVETISCDAMESLYWLTRILLHQRG
ncbi:uncharacterized protein LOC132244140 isoform X4 [Alligator mississippiensis]|uniref:uncharacterized protein LOC132244140 isoform X4 n=1 Tax=Alligator mississippiensis TaxID=8496 RepID=UPI0028781064|nr:uncharacterized protein LOC132244140 isoform X4 [Alligator mississippiensis]